VTRVYILSVSHVKGFQLLAGFYFLKKRQELIDFHICSEDDILINIYDVHAFSTIL
jgi:hypothetical protein